MRAAAAPLRADWRNQARCGDLGTDLFYPTGTTGSAFDAQVTAAKAVCALCPVTAECLAYAKHTRQQFGVWGGVLFGKPDREPGRPTKGRVT